MSDTHVPRRIWRSIGAVLVGLIAIVVFSIATDIVMRLSGAFPASGPTKSDAPWYIATAYRFVYGMAGCYLAARLAPRRPMLHSMILGGVGMALGLVGVIMLHNSGPEMGPMWYALAVFAMPLPCAWAGGKLCDVQLRARRA